MIALRHVDPRQAGRIAGKLAILLRSWSKADDGPARQLLWHEARDCCKELFAILGNDGPYNMIPAPFVKGLGPALEALWLVSESLWSDKEIGLSRSEPPDNRQVAPESRIKAIERIGRELVESNTAQTLLIEPMGDEFPPDDDWHFEPGKVWFRRAEYTITGKPRELLEAIVKMRRKGFTQLDVDQVWGEDRPDGTNFRVQLGKVRDVARRIAAASNDFAAFASDPVPYKDGGWTWLLPLKNLR